jgi:hypothetical protein
MSAQYMPQFDNQQIFQQGMQMPQTEPYYGQPSSSSSPEHTGYYRQQHPPIHVPTVQLPLNEQATPYVEPMPVVAPAIPQAPMQVLTTLSQPPSSVPWPDWVKDALLVAGVVILFGHQSSRNFLSAWIPALKHICDDRQTVFNLAIFGLMVGAGSVAAKRFILNRK